MKYIHLDSLDIEVSCLGLGGWQLGGHGWGKTSEKDLVKSVHKALRSGITLFDTAPIYGLGFSEITLGKALSTERKNVIITTKVGLLWDEKESRRYVDNSPLKIEQEIESSLIKLGTDYIDIYQIHWPDPNTPIEDTLLAMENLKRAGKIRAIGCCNFSLEQIKEAVKYSQIGSVQIPYNLIDTKVESEIFPFCNQHNIAVFAYSPLARGLLSAKYDRGENFMPDDHRSRSEDEYFKDESFAKNSKILEKLRLIARKLDKTPSQIALRWVLENPCITTAIFGVKSPDQVEENVMASNFALANEDIKFLNQVDKNCLN